MNEFLDYHSLLLRGWLIFLLSNATIYVLLADFEIDVDVAIH